MTTLANKILRDNHGCIIAMAYKRGNTMQFEEIPDEYHDLRNKISSIVEQRASIEIKEVKDIDKVLSIVKAAMKDHGASFRVRTNKRAAAAVATTGTGLVGGTTLAIVAELTTPFGVAAMGAAAAPFVVAVGLVGGAGILAHRIITKNADYEIVKHPLKKQLDLIFKK